MNKFSLETPEYIVCPQCKTQIKLDLRKKNVIKTDEISHLELTVPRYIGKTLRRGPTRFGVCICNHCREIIGINNLT